MSLNSSVYGTTDLDRWMEVEGKTRHWKRKVLAVFAVLLSNSNRGLDRPKRIMYRTIGLNMKVREKVSTRFAYLTCWLRRVDGTVSGDFRRFGCFIHPSRKLGIDVYPEPYEITAVFICGNVQQTKISDFHAWRIETFLTTNTEFITTSTNRTR